MNRWKRRIAAGFFAFAVLTLLVAVSPEAQAPAVDPAAVQILKRMTDYVGSLQQFSVHTQNTLEDVLDSGQRVDCDVSASVLVGRPNKLRAERQGVMIEQIFNYDGKTLTLYNPSDKDYSTKPAPGTIEEMLDFAREELGFVIPASDLVYRYAFPLMMQQVTSAKVIGKAVINGVRSDHLLFSRPGVDFQLWVADSGKPLPIKYVVTDRSTPELVSTTTVMSDWNVAPAVGDTLFNFVPPQGAKQVNFTSFETGSGACR